MYAKKILFPTDFSTLSDAALRHATCLWRAPCGKLVALQVGAQPENSFLPRMPLPWAGAIGLPFAVAWPAHPLRERNSLVRRVRLGDRCEARRQAASG